MKPRIIVLAAMLTIGCNGGGGSNSLPIPLPPQNVEAKIDDSLMQIVVSWQDKSNNEDGYRIWRSTDGINFFQLVELSANESQYTDSTVSECHSYYYQVAAFNEYGSSTRIATGKVTFPLQPPTNVMANYSLENNQVEVSWKNNSSCVTTMEIWRQSNTGKFNLLQTLAINQTSYTDSALAECSRYQYQIAIANSNSGASNKADSNTVTTPPNQPIGVEAKEQIWGRQHIITFFDQSNCEDGFRIYRKVNNRGWQLLNELPAANLSLIYYINTDIQEYNVYCYAISAFSLSTGDSMLVESNCIDSVFRIGILATKQTSCAESGGHKIPCDNKDFPGQDGFYQAGVRSTYTDNQDGTVTDNATGLMWSKTLAPGRMTWQEALQYCESLELAGYSDWRLPKIKELHDLVNYDENGPAMDAVFETDGDRSFLCWSSSRVDGNIWYVGFTNGTIGTEHSTKNYLRARAVRGKYWLEAEPSYVDNNDDTITDNVNSLMWAKTPAVNLMTWQEALQYCENLKLGGYSDWRLPNINELRSLVQYDKDSSATDPLFEFPEFESALYWSSSHDIGIAPAYVWTMLFSPGGTSAGWVSTSPAEYYECVRAVRGGL